uniref:Uncharacterized protein n=1 Tax=Populus alba TaxID=43335 RepID=A0A4U5Q6V2_POPAL|nr:hypothetical protein D5086_0000136360 [Populus alba]
MLEKMNGCLKDYHFPVLASILTRSPDLESLSMTCNENRYQPDCSRKLKNKTTQFCKQREGFGNLIGHQLQETEIEVKGKGHQVGVVENLLKIAKGSKKMIIISSKANLKSLSKTADYSSSKPSILSVFSPKTAVPNAICSLHRRDHHSSVDKSSDEANVGLLRDNEKAKILLLFCYNSIAIGSDDSSSDFRFLQMVNATKGLFISCSHMFIQPHVSEMIRSAIADFREQNSYEKPL